MRFATAFLLLFSAAANAQTVAYPASATAGSVVTNAGIVYTNDFTADPFSETNWSFFTSGDDTVTHDGGSSLAWRHTTASGNNFLIYSNPSAFASAVWTLYLGWTNFGTPGVGSGAITFAPSFWLSGTQKVQQVNALSNPSPSSVDSTLGYTGSFDAIKILTGSAGGTSFMNIAYFSFSSQASITTNSGSGASGSVSVGGKALGVSRR